MKFQAYEWGAGTFAGLNVSSEEVVFNENVGTRKKPRFEECTKTVYVIEINDIEELAALAEKYDLAIVTRPGYDGPTLWLEKQGGSFRQR